MLIFVEEVRLGHYISFLNFPHETKLLGNHCYRRTKEGVNEISRKINTMLEYFVFTFLLVQ